MYNWYLIIYKTIRAAAKWEMHKTCSNEHNMDFYIIIMKHISENIKLYTIKGNTIIVSFKTCMLTYGTRFFSFQIILEFILHLIYSKYVQWALGIALHEGRDVLCQWHGLLSAKINTMKSNTSSAPYRRGENLLQVLELISCNSMNNSIVFYDVFVIEITHYDSRGKCTTYMNVKLVT